MSETGREGREGREGEEDAVERETEAAAEEAGAIGGRRPADRPDSPDEPVLEAGGGVAEGFEGSEQALRDHAEHRDAGGNPKYDRPDPEEDGDIAVHGESDAVESSEVPDADR